MELGLTLKTEVKLKVVLSHRGANFYGFSIAFIISTLCYGNTEKNIFFLVFQLKEESDQA